MKIAKKILKIAGIIIGSFILLNLIIVLIFSIPSVQKYAADFVIKKLQPQVKTEMRIDRIRIKLLNSVSVGGIYVADWEKDTLVYAEKLDASFKIMDLLKNQLTIKSVALDNFHANIYKHNPDSAFNFQFFIDAFAPKDSVPKTEEKRPLLISIDDIELKNGTLSYNILSEPNTPGEFNVNHIFVTELKLDADIPSLDMQNLKANINKMSFREINSGVNLTELKGEVRSDSSKYNAKKINLAFNNSSIKINSASYDLNTKAFKIEAKSEKIEPIDVAIFAGMVSHLNKPLSFEANLEGQLPQARINKLIVDYGADTHAYIKGYIADYTKYENADFDINVDELVTTSADLENFMRIGSPTFVAPQQLKALKKIDLFLKASGKITGFDVTTRLSTAPGNIVFNGKGSASNQFGNINIDGNVITNNLKVAALIGDNAGVNDVSLNTHATLVMKKDQPLSATANGVVRSVTYNNYVYRDIAINGIYNGDHINAHISTNTDDNKLNVVADLNVGKPMKVDIEGTIDKLFLDPIVKVEDWQNPFLTTKIDAKLSGSDIDNMVGNVTIDSTSLYDDNFIYNPGPIYVQALSAEENGEKKIQIFSTILEGEVSGDYHFSTIGNEISHLLSQHLPTLIPQPKTKKETNSNYFTIDFTLKNTEDLSYALTLPFVNVEPATIKGVVDMTRKQVVELNTRFPRIMFGQNDVRESTIKAFIGNNDGVKVDANTYLVQNTGHISAHLNTVGRNDSLSNVLSFNVNTNVAQSDGRIDVSLGFLRDINEELNANINFHRSNIMFNGKTINVIPSVITYEKDKITVNDFELREEQMLLLGIDGIASKEREDSVSVFFNNTDLETILAAFKVANLKGSINGGVVVHQALADPIIHTDNFRIENIRTPSDTLGTLTLEGDWDMIKDGLTVGANLRNRGHDYLVINGFIPMGSPNPMDVNLNLDKLPLSVVQPFAQSTFSQLSGTINSKIAVTGKLDAPKTEGWVGINDGVMTVAYTNVTYKISDTINISPETIGLNNLIITDNNNNQAKINVLLSHSNFDGMSYTVKVNLDDFLLLNNERSTDMIAYGTLKLSGDIDITGSSSGIYGNVNLRNDSRSKIMIEMPQTAQATTYSGIIYINTPEQTDSLSFLRKNENNGKSVNTRLQSDMPINIQGLINVNPMFEAGVEINPATGDKLEIKGTSELRFTFDSQSTPSVRLYGDYVAEDGKFKYNFQGLKTIDFSLEEGSTVTLVGDPMNTQFNITAFHQVNADLSKLSPVFATELATPRMPVNATLEIQGNLDRMNLDYDIELPDAPNETKQRLNSIISTEEQKNKQFAALILTGGFMPAEGSVSMGSNDNVAASFAIGQISKGLDALLAGALNDNWSISTNLESTDGTFDNMRMNVDVSTRLFDDRLRISTNLSYGDNSTLASQQAFMGEFELEYDINNWLMMRAYNRANQRFSKRAPTTQGVGVVVTRNSKHFKDLFKFSFRKKDDKR